jgi:hypothetical protein
MLWDKILFVNSKFSMLGWCLALPTSELPDGFIETLATL